MKVVSVMNRPSTVAWGTLPLGSVVVDSLHSTEPFLVAEYLVAAKAQMGKCLISLKTGKIEDMSADTHMYLVNATITLEMA